MIVLPSYPFLVAARTRAPFIAGAVSLFAVIGVYNSRRNEVGQTWGLTAVLACALTAWLISTILDSEPRIQAEMATVALGGRVARAQLEAKVVLLVSIALTVMFVGYPCVLGLFVSHVFDRRIEAGDVLASIFAHLCCSLLGGAIAVLYAAPRITRRPAASGATVFTLIGLIAVSSPLRSLGGPLAVARALTDAPRGSLTGHEIVACTTCVVLAVVVIYGAAVWTRRSR